MGKAGRRTRGRTNERVSILEENRRAIRAATGRAVAPRDSPNIPYFKSSIKIENKAHRIPPYFFWGMTQKNLKGTRLEPFSLPNAPQLEGAEIDGTIEKKQQIPIHIHAFVKYKYIVEEYIVEISSGYISRSRAQHLAEVLTEDGLLDKDAQAGLCELILEFSASPPSNASGNRFSDVYCNIGRQ